MLKYFIEQEGYWIGIVCFLIDLQVIVGKLQYLLIYTNILKFIIILSN